MSRNNALPPLSYYPQPQGIENTDYSNNLSIIRSQTPIIDNNNNNNINNNYYLLNQNMMKEIRELKMSLKAQLQNQNELQKKLIDSYKLISQQDNIIRLNTSKINEHDLKLANISSSFNNFLEVQENTNNLLNECENKINNNLLTIETFSSFKSQIQNNYLIINEKLKKIFTYNDNTDLILNDLKNTDENNLNLLLGKIRLITDKEETFFSEKHQENLNYIKDNNNLILSKINQLNEFIDKVQVQVAEETNCRKINDNKILKDVINYMVQEYEKKFKNLEKNSLETEKKLINMNKDYAKTIQEIVAKQKDGNDTEFQNIKMLIEKGLKKNQVKYDNDINEMKKLISTVKGDINENKSTIDKIDGFVKENIKIMNEFKKKGDENIIDFSKKLKQIEQDSLKKYEETKNNILKELKDNINKEKEIRNKFEKNIDDKITSKLHSYDNNIKDLKEKSQQLKKMIENKYEIENKENNSIGINNINLDEIYTNKLNNLNKDIQENYKLLNKKIEDRINSFKINFEKEINKEINKVESELYKKFDVLLADFNDKIDKSRMELDGKIQQYLVEYELRFKKKYDEFTKLNK